MPKWWLWWCQLKFQGKGISLSGCYSRETPFPMPPYNELFSLSGVCRDLEEGLPSRFCYCCCLVIKSCMTLRDPMDQSMPCPPVFDCLPQLGQIHVGCFDYTIQPSHPLSSPSPLAFTLSQHQGLFQGVFASHEMAKVLEPQFQDLSFQWALRVDSLQNG